MFLKIKKPFLIFAFFWVVASATFSGFAAKWGLRDGPYRYSISRVIDGTANRPYVYRQLLPKFAELVEKQTSPVIVEKVSRLYTYGPFSFFTKANNFADSSPSYKFKWIVIYWASFFALLAALPLLYLILVHFQLSQLSAIFAPAIFALCLPIIQSYGGYYYDFSELFFISLVVYFIIKDKNILAALAVALATLNKETFLFFLPCCWPLLPEVKSKLQKLLIMGSLMFIAVGVNIWVKIIYANNPGDIGENHLFENITTYLRPSAYWQFDDSYALIAPIGFNIINIVLLYFLGKTSWSFINSKIKRHTLIGLVINTPLFLIFGYRNEIRGLSFLYIGCVFLVAHTIERFKKHQEV